MKFPVTFAVPCYNSAAFMRKCIDSLLPAAESCEILLINDGSTDETSAIAHEYARLHENIIAIDQENANWGGAINRALSMARGTYFKVVDSDDSLNEQPLLAILASIEDVISNESEPDLIIANYIYDRISDNSKRKIQYHKFFPRNRIFRWPEMGKPRRDQFIMIHASWYKTSLLRESGLKLPKGVSYMDSLYILHPMPLVKTLLYLDEYVYNYTIGRAGQSVEIEEVKKHIDEQILASKLAIDDVDYTEICAREPRQASLMIGYISCMMTISTIYLFKINTPETLKKNDELWSYMERRNPTLYRHVKHSMAGLANRKTPCFRIAARGVYTILKAIYKFA